MGTGKTLTTIAVAGVLAQRNLVHRMLIVAPLSIVGVWQSEFERFADFDYALEILEGSSARKRNAIQRMNGSALQVLVVNYESAWRLEKELLKWGADLIVADEGHKIKTHSTAAAKALHRMGARARYRLLLTGTIITNKAIDVFSQYKFAAPEVYGPSFFTFRNRFFDMTGYGNYTPVLRRSTEPEFTQRLHSIAFRATKAECLDLPAATDIIQRIELEPSALALYRDLARDSFAELGSGSISATNVLTRLLRLSQLTGGFLGDDSHALSDLSGPLSIVKGGTGQTTAALARNAMGLGNTTGALPIANGGTGQNTAALARNALGLGNTAGALPIANGGTGATSAKAAMNAIGIFYSATLPSSGTDGQVCLVPVG